MSMILPRFPNLHGPILSPNPRRSPKSSRSPVRSTPPPTPFPSLALCLLCLALTLTSTTSAAPPPAPLLALPTENKALLQPGSEPAYFAPTVGKTWVAGTFGCVRTEGWQIHEGIDILTVRRDRRGEPMDDVRATATGTVAYTSRIAGLSNYGNYAVVRHPMEGLELYSLYAHLREIDPALKPGSPLRQGEVLGKLGRTTNSRQGIGKDRAHLHFELDFLINERFPQWLAKTFPGQRNDHGAWNGRNLIGLDPGALLTEQHRLGPAFNLLRFVTNQTELCRVRLRGPMPSFLRRNPGLLIPRAGLDPARAAGFEVSLNYNGLPFRWIPLTASEAPQKTAVTLIAVNATEAQARPCRKLVRKQGNAWQLAPQGQHLLDLILY